MSRPDAKSPVTIEGLTLSDAGVYADAERRRIEIDAHTGLIARITEATGKADLVLDDEQRILPGFIDLHVHARQDPTSKHSYKETFATAGWAAINGGVIAFADMPNNPSPPIDDRTYLAKKALAESCPVDVLLYAAVGPRTEPLSFRVPYKAYLGQSIGDLWFDNVTDLRNALGRYRGQKVAFHAELPDVLRIHRNASTHEARRPPTAEIEAIDVILDMCGQEGVEPHICHLSTSMGLRRILEARRYGMTVTCEVAPHHLFFDQSNANSCWAPQYLQVNPPIRTAEDRHALLSAFAAGDIDYLATDHAPHSLAEKGRGMSGITHLDTYGPFFFWLLQQGVPLGAIVRASSTKPGLFLSDFTGLHYGRIEVGYIGSLTVVVRSPITIRREELRTRSGWSPFEGLMFGGRVTHTIVRGRVYGGK